MRASIAGGAAAIPPRRPGRGFGNGLSPHERDSPQNSEPGTQDANATRLTANAAEHVERRPTTPPSKHASMSSGDTSPSASRARRGRHKTAKTWTGMDAIIDLLNGARGAKIDVVHDHYKALDNGFDTPPADGRDVTATRRRRGSTQSAVKNLGSSTRTTLDSDNESAGKNCSTLAGSSDDAQAELERRMRAFVSGGTVRGALTAIRTAPRDKVSQTALECLVEVCAKASQVDRAAQVLSKMFPKYGIAPSGKAFRLLVVAYGKVGDIRSVIRLLTWPSLQRLSKEDMSVVYTSAIDSAARCNRLDEAFAMLDTMHIQNVPRSERVYAVLVRGCAKNKPLSIALSVLRRMKEDGFSPQTVDTYNALLDGCSRAGRLAAARSILKKMKKDSKLRPNLASYNAFLACCGKAKDPDRAFEVLSEMKQSQGIKPNARSYNFVVVACASVGDVERAFAIAEEMRDAGIRINVVTYNNLVQACCIAGRIDRAFALVKEMVQAQGLSPNSHTYNILIRGCGQWGELEAALRLLQSMPSAGVHPTVITYSVAVAACARTGGSIALDKAFELVRTMRENGVKPNIVTYNSLIHACSRGRNPAMAFQLLDSMRKDGITPDTVTQCSLVDAYGRVGDLDAAFEAISTLPMEFPSLRPTLPTFNALIHACGKSGRLDRMAAAVRQMRHQKLRPNVVTYSTLISAYGSHGEMEKAMSVLRNMERKGLRPNRLTYTSLVAGYGQLGLVDKAIEMFDVARASCGDPDEELYTSAIVSAVAGNRDELALQLAEEMKKGGFNVPFVLDRLMLRVGRVERSGRELEALLNAIEALGIRPTRGACESLVAAYAMEANVDSALAVLPTMTRLGYPPNLRTYKKILEGCGLARNMAMAKRIFVLLRRKHIGQAGLAKHYTHHWVELYETFLRVAMQGRDSKLAEAALARMRKDCGDQYASDAKIRVLGVTRAPSSQAVSQGGDIATGPTH